MENKNKLSKTKKILLFLALIFIFIFSFVSYKNYQKEKIDFVTVNNLLSDESNRFIFPVNGVENSNGFFFLGKFSEFYNVDEQKSEPLKTLNNLNPIYVQRNGSNEISIINKNANNNLEILTYNLNTKSLQDKKVEIKIDEKSAEIGNPFKKEYKIYVPVFCEQKSDYFIVFDENLNNYSISEHNFNNTKGKFFVHWGTSNVYNLGGYDKETKKYSNKIYESLDCKTEKLFATIDMNKNSNYFWVIYYGFSEKDSSYDIQEIWVINGSKLTKINGLLGEIEEETLPKEFENAKLLKVITELSRRQIGFIEQDNKIYYFKINYGKKIKLKYLMDLPKNGIDFSNIYVNHKKGTVYYVFCKSE